MEVVVGLTTAFATASALFFTALGAAATYNEPLKAFLSLSAFLMSAIWLRSGVLIATSSIWSFNFHDIVYMLAIMLPGLFLVGWAISSMIHFFRWYRGIEGKGVDRHQ